MIIIKESFYFLFTAVYDGLLELGGQIMSEKMRRVIAFLTFIFGWIPALPLAVFCCSAFIGVLPVIITDPLKALVYTAWFTSGLLGFLALTSVALGAKLNFIIRFVFLILGCISALIAGVFLWTKVSLTLQNSSWIYSAIYVFVFSGPIVCGGVHAIFHYRFIKKGNFYRLTKP